MRKIYQKPVIEVTDMMVESMLCESTTLDPSKHIGADGFGSRGDFWLDDEDED